MTCASPSSPNWPADRWLDVSDGHRLWWCEGGDALGLPVLILHGGPGGASRWDSTRWFDGLPVRWIVMDQRGCGRSLPAGSTRANDLKALVDDVRALRAHLGLAAWALVGGSWGARLALACAQAEPRVLRGLFLRSPFVGSQAEAAAYVSAWSLWLGAAGRAALGAEREQALLDLFRSGTSAFIDGASGRSCAVGEDEALARAWAAYDEAQSLPGGVAASGARWSAEGPSAMTPSLRASWCVHAHYAATSWGAGTDGAAAPTDEPMHEPAPPALAATLPISVVWGAADVTCDPAVADRLARRWPWARRREVPGAGHRMGDARMAEALVQEIRTWVQACAAASVASGDQGASRSLR